MALDSEMSGAMTIGQVGWQRAGSAGSSTGSYYYFKLYMGLSAGDELSETFADNYIPGTRTLVYENSIQVMKADADQWMMIDLDTPFWYNGQDNLVVELEWSGGSNVFYTYMWPTGSNRGLLNKMSTEEPEGALSTAMSRLMFTGTLALQQDTFGSIKARLGRR